MSLDGVTFRPIEPDEVSLVLDSWFKSYRESDWAGVVPNHLFFDVMRQMVAGLIARGAKITAAAAAGRVLGWACYERKDDATVLHYVYVKDPFRRRGLGRALVAEAIGDATKTFYTARTRYSKHVAPKAAQFRPEIARRKEI